MKWRPKLPAIFKQDVVVASERSVVYELPPEIWCQILQILYNGEDERQSRSQIANIWRSCRYLNQIATPILYCRIIIDFKVNMRLPAYVERLQCSPDLAAAVKLLVLQGGMGDQWISSSDCHTTSSIEALLGVCGLLHTMTGLQQLKCIRMPVFEFFYYTIFNHPTLPHLSILATRTLVGDHRLDRVLDGEFIRAGHWAIPAPVDCKLRNFETNSSLAVRALILSGVAKYLQCISIVLPQEPDNALVMELVTYCPNVRLLAYKGAPLAQPLPMATLKSLESFDGSAHDAAILIPGRSIRELRASRSYQPHFVDDGTNLDLASVNQILQSAKHSTVPLQSLTFQLRSYCINLLRLIRGDLPCLECLHIVYVEAPSVVFSAAMRTFIESEIFNGVGGFQGLTEFHLSGAPRWDYIANKEWELWEPRAVKEMAKRCPSLRTVSLVMGRSWHLSSTDWCLGVDCIPLQWKEVNGLVVDLWPEVRVPKYDKTPKRTVKRLETLLR